VALGNFNLSGIIRFAEVPEERPVSVLFNTVFRLPFARRSPGGDPGAAVSDRCAPTVPIGNFVEEPKAVGTRESGGTNLDSSC
jgi:hypothetical protein